MSHVPSMQIYAGINELIAELHRREVSLAIVTKSPDMIPKAFAKHHGWPITNIVGYHHVKQRKPHPEGLLLAMRNAGADPTKVCHVGDLAEDTAAARAAGVLALGAAWGCEDLNSLVASSPDRLVDSVEDLSEFLLNRYRMAKS